ncbi:MAG: DNA primase small subunit PriS [Thermoplasmata archaeon]
MPDSEISNREKENKEKEIRIAKTLAYLEKRFSEYYASADIKYPYRWGRREWGFMFFGKDMMQRHVAFQKADEIRAFLSNRSPAHVYYSVAYYEKPNAPKMQEKNWKGADLVFDLDADHIEGANEIIKEENGFEKILEMVKKEFIYLIEEFILRDFGFSKDELEITFSGGRGYHLHITNSAVLSLGAKERREFVDYITGTGLDINTIFPEVGIKENVTYFGSKVIKKREMPSADAPAWKGRMTRGVLRLVDELEKMDRKEAIKRIMRLEGVGEVSAQKIYSDLFDVVEVKRKLTLEQMRILNIHPSEIEVAKVRGVDKIRKDNNFWIFREDELCKIFFEIVKSTVNIPILVKQKKKKVEKEEGNEDSQKSLESFDKKKRKKDKQIAEPESAKLFETSIGGETDEPVTSDIKRLIRMPYSLHGKTGLKVVSMNLDELKKFDPLRDAVVFPDTPIKVEITKPINIRLKEKRYSIDPGLVEVPEYVAIYAMCRGCALVAE